MLSFVATVNGGFLALGASRGGVTFCRFSGLLLPAAVEHASHRAFHSHSVVPLRLGNAAQTHHPRSPCLHTSSPSPPLPKSQPNACENLPPIGSFAYMGNAVMVHSMDVLLSLAPLRPRHTLFFQDRRRRRPRRTREGPSALQTWRRRGSTRAPRLRRSPCLPEGILPPRGRAERLKSCVAAGRRVTVLSLSLQRGRW